MIPGLCNDFAQGCMSSHAIACIQHIEGTLTSTKIHWGHLPKLDHNLVQMYMTTNQLLSSVCSVTVSFEN